jgi:hypothetical protein
MRLQRRQAVVVWDGLTFKPQLVYSDVSAASMALGTNAMMYIKELDHNLEVMSNASVKFQDDMAIIRYEESIANGKEDPLEEGTYVLKKNRPPQQQEKLRMKWTGPYKVVKKLRPDFYEVLDLVQNQTDTFNRGELKKVNCPSDEVARQEFAKDQKELFITEVISHVGEPQKQGTVKFTCRIEGLSHPQEFKFRDCRLVPQIRDYILKHRDLHYLKPQTIDNTSEKRRSKGKYRKESSIYFSDF